jgi:TonB-linked SusC/RagA family outer membrane protein
VRKFCAIALVLLASAFYSNDASAQQRRITGRVTATGSGEALANVAVNVVGTAIGTYTADDGSFQLLAPEGDVSVLARRVGYKRSTIRVPAGQMEANFGLERDVLQLEAQVITGQATTVSTLNAANSVTVVSAEQLARVPSPTIDNALQGKVPGAVISSNSGAPGGGTQIQIRGVTSINATSTPLYVVDGVIVSNTAIFNGLNAVSQASRVGSSGQFSSTQDQPVNRIADLNPNDIESIEILKGPSAGAIYGSKGSNGVVVITTKRGRGGRPQVNFTQRFGTYDLANKIGTRCYTLGEYLSWAGASSAADTTAETALFNQNGGGCNDFEEQMYGENSLSYETSASVAGGNGGTTYYVSGLAKNDAGIQKNTYAKKQSLRANVGQQFGSRVLLRANTELIHTLTDRGMSGNDNNNVNPYTIFSSTPGFFRFRNSNGSYNENPFLPQRSNPLQIAAQFRAPEDVFRLIGGGNLNFQAYSSERQTIDLNVQGGADAFGYRAKVNSPGTLYYETRDDGLPGTVVNATANVVSANVSATGTHKYATPMFTATTSAGLRQDRSGRVFQTITGRGFFPQQTDVNQALQTFVDENQQLVKTFSYYAQEEFLTLGEKLLLTAALNSERSSNNGDAEKFYTYPKFSASYILPVLPPFTDNLKLRVAYGKAGNQPPFGYKFTNLITFVNDAIFSGRPSSIQGDPNIKPETATEIEGGFDAQFWQGRAGFDFTMYRKQVDDLILQATLAPSTGFTTKILNGGQMVNKGVEIGLNLNPYSSELFDWTSRTTFSRDRGILTELDPSVTSFLAGSYFSNRYGAVRITEGKSTTQVEAQVGCGVPLNSLGRCPTANIVYGIVGDERPDFTMGFSNDFRVGPVRVSTLLDWRKGGMVANLTNNYFDGADTYPDAEVGRARLAAYRRGEPVYAENAGFVKLREITLSYQLPEALVSRSTFGAARDLRLELLGRNLKTWTRYSGLDPEVSNFGSQNLGRFQDVTPYPPSRQVWIGINAGF